MRRHRVAVLLTLILLVLPVCCFVCPVPAYAATAIAPVQKGTEVSGSGSSVTPTLPAASTAGHLLVATTVDLNSGCTTDNFTVPAGWVQAASVCRGSTGPLILWYRPNAPAGITSVTFGTGSNGSNPRAQLTEYSGVATVNPLDEVGTRSSTTSSTTLAVTTAGTVSAAGELAVTGFATGAGLSTYAPGSGWTSLNNDPGDGFDSDYRVGPPSGSTLTESATSSPQTTWGAVIATFVPACAGGSRTVKASPTLSFPSVALNGYNKAVTQTAIFTADDQSGTGSGWNVTATSTTFSAGSGRVLPTTATKTTAASAAAASGNCSMPLNSVSYPMTLPAGTSPPTAARIYNAAGNSGMGPVNITLTAQVTLPANAAVGAYASTWTITIASGP